MYYSLTKKQVQRIEKMILDQRIHYQPFIDEMVDHLSVKVEGLMNEGHSFDESLKIVLSKAQLQEVKKLEYTTKRHLNFNYMLKNYFKLAYRALKKYPGTSFINLVGLSLGFTVAILTFLYVSNEYSYDNFHHDPDNIQRVATSIQFDNGDLYETAFSGAPWGPAFVSDVPEVEEMCRLMKYRLPVMMGISNMDVKFYEKNMIWADSTFFSLFNYKLIEGDPKSALGMSNQVVVTESTAKRYFGDESPLGKVITYENNQELLITGVIEDFPENTHFNADLIGSFATLPKFWRILDRWGVVYYYTYLRMNNSVQEAEIIDKLEDVLSANMGEDASDYTLSLKAINDIHTSGNLENELTNNSSTRYLNLVVLIALVVLAASVINYINLATARSLKRVKEVGITKVMGSGKILVITKFIAEAFIVTSLAFFLSLIATGLLANGVSQLFDATIRLRWSPGIVLFSFVLILVCTFLSGGYMAMKMSGISPLKALNGQLNLKTGRGVDLKKVLVTFQFMSCIGLIAANLIIQKQVKFLFTRELGYDKSHVVSIPVYSTQLVPIDKFPVLKNDFTELASVKDVAISSHNLIGDQPYNAAYAVDRYDTLIMGRLHVDHDFVDVFDIDVLAGRNLLKTVTNDTSNFLINESAVKAIGIKSPEEAIGHTMSYTAQNRNGSYRRTGTIVGVVKDFNFRSLHSDIGPIVMDIQPSRTHFINVKLSTNDYTNTIDQLRTKWNDIFQHGPFEYVFLEDKFDTAYKFESSLKQLSFWFVTISVVIAILGLIGLTHFDTSIRLKEISIRKVLGSSTTALLILFWKDYIKMIAIGALIALPAVWYILNKWLSGYAFRAEMSFLQFGYSISLTVVLVTVSTAIIIFRASNTKLTEILRNE